MIYVLKQPRENWQRFVALLIVGGRTFFISLFMYNSVCSSNRPNKEIQYLLHATLLLRLIHELNRKERPKNSLLFLCSVKHSSNYQLNICQLFLRHYIPTRVVALLVVIDKCNAQVMLALEHDLDWYHLFFPIKRSTVHKYISWSL